MGGRLLSLTIMILILTAGSLCSQEYSFGVITPEKHAWTQNARTIGAELTRETQGRLRLVVHHSGYRGNEASMLGQLERGELDFAFLTVGELSQRDRELGAFFAPFLVPDPRSAASLLRSEIAHKMLGRINRHAQIVGLAYGMGGMRQMAFRQPIRDGADLKGKFVRVSPFPAIKDFYGGLGAIVVPLPLSVARSALERGDIDGADMDLEILWRQGYADVVDMILLSQHMMFPMVAVASQKTWQSLEPADQQLFRAIVCRHLDGLLDAYAVLDLGWRDHLERTEVKLVEVDPTLFADGIANWQKNWQDVASIVARLRASITVQPGWERQPCTRTVETN